MKNSSTIIHIALGLAILVLYILHFSSRGGQPTGENSSPSDTIRNASGKSRPIRRSSTASPADSLRLRIAYVNSDTLLARYSYYQQKKKELEARQQQIESDLQKRQSDLQNDAMTFQQSLSQGAMTEAQARERQETLLKKEQSLIRYGQNLESSFLKEEQRLNEELIRKITSYIEQYAQQNNYDYVFGYSLATVAAGIIYGDQAYNITNEIVAGLNAGADK